MALTVVVFFLPAIRRHRESVGWLKNVLVALIGVACASGLILLDNKSVTGSWTTLPYMLSRYQYGIPAGFTVEANPVPHIELTREQQLAYQIQSSVHGPATDSIKAYAGRLLSRVEFFRFFFLAPLYIALPLFVLTLRQNRFAWVLMTIVIFAVGTNFYPYFYPHYIAAEMCLFVLVAVAALDQLSRITVFGHSSGSDAMRLILFLCFAQFLFWYSLHLAGKNVFAREMWQYETVDAINYGDPYGRDAVRQELLKAPERQLVFVRYGPEHTITEWVFNGADIDGSKIVWARDLGAIENEKLRQYFPDRKAWLLEADARPPRLSAYEPPKIQLSPVEVSKQPLGRLKFEEVK